MKELNKRMFGFSIVNAGQRGSANIEPKLIAVSTTGGFRLTGAVTKMLGAVPGDNIMFINNVAEVDKAILDSTHEFHEAIVEFCSENELDITTPDAALAIHNEFDMWAIAKGIQELDAKGNAKKIVERASKKDVYAYIDANFDEVYAQAMSAEGEKADAIKEVLTREGVTREEQIDVLMSAVSGKEIDKYTGSKTANASGLIGTGVALNFTDTNIWAQLKAGLGDKVNKINRVFTVDIENPQVAVVNNGYEDVQVKAYVLGSYVDKTPARNAEEEE